MNQTLQDALEKLDPNCDDCRDITEQYQPDLTVAARQALIDLVAQHLKWQHPQNCNSKQYSDRYALPPRAELHQLLDTPRLAAKLISS